MDCTAPLPKKVATVERWSFSGVSTVYAATNQNESNRQNIWAHQAFGNMGTSKKKNERTKERKEERKKNSKTNLTLSLGIGAFWGVIHLQRSDDVTKNKFVKLWDSRSVNSQRTR